MVQMTQMAPKRYQALMPTCSCIIQLTFIHAQPHLRQFIPDVAGWAMTLFRRYHLGHAMW